MRISLKTFTLAALFATTAAFVAISPSVAPVLAQKEAKQVNLDLSDEEVDEIIKENIKAVTRGGPKSRIEAIIKIAATNSPKALDKLLKVFNPKKFKTSEDQKVLFALAEAIGSFTSDKAVSKISKTVKKMKKSEDIYLSYLILKGIVQTDSEEARKVMETALESRSWPMAAGLQAIIEHPNPYYVPHLLEFLQGMRDLPTERDLEKDRQAKPTLNKDFEKDILKKMPILAVAALEAFGKSHVHVHHEYPMKGGKPDTQSEAYKKFRAAEDETLNYLEELKIMIQVLESDDYSRYFAARAFAEMAGLEGTTDSDRWLTHYLSERRFGRLDSSGLPVKVEGETGPGRTRIKGPAFVGMPPVGKRIVICIDISSSMEQEVTDEVIEERKEKERGPISGEGGKKEKEKDKEEKKSHRERIKWKKIKTKMDLAKADCKLTISDMDESYLFNIVTYSKESDFLDAKTTGFVKATEANKKKFIKLVEDIETVNKTNIHGAILDAFRVTLKGALPKTADPATDPKGLLEGANTIFFLTDGYGTWCDDSVGYTKDKRITNSTDNAVGDGNYIYKDQIIVDFVRLNKFRKCIVNTVGIGQHDRDLMAWMAYESGGQYMDLSGSGRKPPKPRKRK